MMKNEQRGRGKKWMGSMALATAMLGGLMLFFGASNAKAQDRDDYYRDDRQVQYTNRRAHEAAERYGYFSREAKHWRHENHEAKEREKHLRHQYREHHRDRY